MRRALVARLAGVKGTWLTRRGPSSVPAPGALAGPPRAPALGAAHARASWSAPAGGKHDGGKPGGSGGGGGAGASDSAGGDGAGANIAGGGRSGSGRRVPALSAASARSSEETRAIRSRKATRHLKKLPQGERDKFFSELQRRGQADVYHYSAMLSHAADSEQADLLLEQMAEAGVRPNVVTYNTLINKHQESGQLHRANALLEGMRASGVRPDVVTYSSLIDGLSRSLRHRQAERLWSQMRELGIQPDAVTYNIVVQMYCRTHRLQDARRTITDMAARNLAPTAATYSPLIAAYGKEGDLHALIHLLHEMHEKKVMLDERAFQAVISAVAAQGLLPAAAALSAEAASVRTTTAESGGGGGGGNSCSWTGKSVATIIEHARVEAPDKKIETREAASGAAGQERRPPGGKAAAVAKGSEPDAPAAQALSVQDGDPLFGVEGRGAGQGDGGFVPASAGVEEGDGVRPRDDRLRGEVGTANDAETLEDAAWAGEGTVVASEIAVYARRTEIDRARGELWRRGPSLSCACRQRAWRRRGGEEDRPHTSSSAAHTAPRAPAPWMRARSVRCA